MVLGVDGLPGFNALRSRKCDEDVQLYAFDCLALEARGLPVLKERSACGSLA